MPYDTFCKDCRKKITASNIVYHGVFQLVRCRDCYNKYHRDYRERNKKKIGTYKTKDSIKNTNLKCLYNITLEEYNRQKELHLGGCAICKQPFDNLSVDHNHKTNEFRGLLCKKCNTGLGAFNDSEILLINAIDYLKRTTWNKKVG